MTVIAAGGYDIIVGPVEAGIERILDATRGEMPLLVTDERVFALHGSRIAEALGARVILVPDGEEAKDWPVLHRLLEQFAAQNASRTTPIVALGGGSIGDLAGLAAALFKRGCPVVHIPTTLLSQADSAIGGKTAIDAFGEKNLIGTFHAPSLVVVDPDLTDTLDERQRRAGYAEIVKYGLIDDPSFFAWCEANGRGVIAGHRDLRLHAIETALTAKARIVEGDVRDLKGQRALLNLGHSFGHALEAETGYSDRLLHGEAVAAGMVLAHQFSAANGLCPPEDAARVRDHLASVDLPHSLASAGVNAGGATLAAHMAHDKKVRGGKLPLILTRGIGQSFVTDEYGLDAVAAFLDG